MEYNAFCTFDFFLKRCTAREKIKMSNKIIFKYLRLLVQNKIYWCNNDGVRVRYDGRKSDRIREAIRSKKKRKLILLFYKWKLRVHGGCFMNSIIGKKVKLQFLLIFCGFSETRRQKRAVANVMAKWKIWKSEQKLSVASCGLLCIDKSTVVKYIFTNRSRLNLKIRLHEGLRCFFFINIKA